MINYQEVRELFNYDEECGVLVSKKVRGSRGSVGPNLGANDRGYKVVGINGKTYRTHRLVWLWYYGYLPENGIDHIDRDRGNNKISNLREVSKRCNSINSKTSSNNISGIRGISWNTKQSKWISTIAINKVTKYLGSYGTKLEAACHRLAAEQCLGWETCSSSSAYKYVLENINKGL